MADVHGDRDMRINGVGGGRCAADADLFLGGRNAHDFGREFLLFPRKADQRFADNVGADLVIKGARGTYAPMDEFKFMVVGCRVANRDALHRLLLGAGPDIDPDFVNLRHLLAVTFVHQVDGPLARHATDGPICCLDNHAAPGNHRAVMATDRVEVEVTVLVDVGDDEAELVHVTGKHEHGIPVGIERGDPVAESVLGIRISCGFDVMVEDGLRLGLIAGGRAGMQEFGEENGSGIGGHGSKPHPSRRGGAKEIPGSLALCGLSRNVARCRVKPDPRARKISSLPRGRFA